MENVLEQCRAFTAAVRSRREGQVHDRERRRSPGHRPVLCARCGGRGGAGDGRERGTAMGALRRSRFRDLRRRDPRCLRRRLEGAEGPHGPAGPIDRHGVVIEELQQRVLELERQLRAQCGVPERVEAAEANRNDVEGAVAVMRREAGQSDL